MIRMRILSRLQVLGMGKICVVFVDFIVKEI